MERFSCISARTFLVAGLIILGSVIARSQEYRQNIFLEYRGFPDSLFIALDPFIDTVEAEVFESAVKAAPLMIVEEMLPREDTVLDLMYLKTANGMLTFYHNPEHQESISYSGLVPPLGAYLISHCWGGTCDDYLVDTVSGGMVGLPHFYDWGIQGLVFSPDARQMAVFDGYDGPDWHYVAPFRSQFYIFNVIPGQGIEGIKPCFSFQSLEWSIEDMVWLDDDTILLMVYRGNRGGNGISGEFEYLSIDGLSCRD